VDLPASRLLAPEPERPLGLVLSGGGARGAFHVGVWEVLRHHGRGLRRAPEVVSGTSAGSINAALIAAGIPPDRMLEFWLDLARRPPVKANDLLFRSLEAKLRRLLVREPFRALGRRRRSLRITSGLVRKHSLHRRAGLLALVLEYLMTARFDTLSELLDGIGTSYLFNTDPFRARLAEVLGGYSVRDTDVRVAINTVAVHSGKVVRFVNRPPSKHTESGAEHYRYSPSITVDMIAASASIPLLFNSVSVGGTQLWDGGLLVNTPIAPAVALGARRIIPVLVTAGQSDSWGEPRSMGVGVERLADAFLENAYNTDRKLLLERNLLAQTLPERGLAVVQLFDAIRPESSRTFNAGSYLYFQTDAMMRMYEAGRAAARAWLARGPRLDTHPRGR
jgi:NTE family protein